MCVFAASPASPAADIAAIVSYQAPTSALPKRGSSSASVLTTSMSMISPGIIDESNTGLTSGSACTSASSGFQVTTAVASSLAKAATMSASEVLTTVRSRSDISTVESARASM